MCPRSSLVLRLSLVALVAVLLPAAAGAQSGLATVTGIVSDESGGAVPGLTVTATNQATNVAYTGLTNDAGNYIMTAVPIGSYVITVEMQGFKGIQSTVTLSAAQTARVDFKLQIGTVTERVEVTATGAVLQTENAVVGNKLERDQVEKLPAVGRNLSAVTLFTAGATSTSPGQFDTLRGGGRPAVNGQRQQGNNFTLDGIDSNEAINNGITYQPSPDAVEQVSVETNNYSAELGNVAGAIVNMVIKSGTNRFSGQRVLLLARQRPGGHAVGHQSGGRHQGEFHAQDLRRHAWRPDRAQQAVLLRELPGRASGQPARPVLRDRRARRVAAGRSQQPPGEEHRHPRSADGTAVPEQPDSYQPVQHLRPQPVRRRGAVPACERHPSAERLPPELPGYDRVDAGGGSGRSESGLERLGLRQVVRAVFPAGGRGQRLGDGHAAVVRVGRPTIPSGASP